MKALLMTILLLVVPTITIAAEEEKAKAKTDVKTEKKATEKKKKTIPLHEHPTIVAMFKENNARRASSGIGPQKLSPKLCKLAQNWSRYMARTGYYDHNYGHPYPEIIYMGPTTIQSAFNGWEASRAHNGIMKSGNTHCGFGYAVSENGTTYWTGVYGSMNAASEASSDNSTGSGEGSYYQRRRRWRRR